MAGIARQGDTSHASLARIGTSSSMMGLCKEFWKLRQPDDSAGYFRTFLPTIDESRPNYYSKTRDAGFAAEDSGLGPRPPKDRHMRQIIRSEDTWGDKLDIHDGLKKGGNSLLPRDPRALAGRGDRLATYP